jgi:hypothetical protein
MPLRVQQVEQKHARIAVQEWRQYQHGWNDGEHDAREGPVEINGDGAEDNHDAGTENIADIHGAPEKPGFVLELESAMRTIIVGDAEFKRMEYGIGINFAGPAPGAFTINKT